MVVCFFKVFLFYQFYIKYNVFSEKYRFLKKLNTDKKAPNLGTLLIDFLKFYSDFNFSYQVIDPKDLMNPSTCFYVFYNI